jgi:hypothetical protein
MGIIGIKKLEENFSRHTYDNSSIILGLGSKYIHFGTAEEERFLGYCIYYVQVK